MKRFWHTCLAMIATATMTAGVANAQNNWNAPSEIGSYQSILSRAGYGQETNVATTALQTAGSGNVGAGSGSVGAGSGSVSPPPVGGSGSVTVPNGGGFNNGFNGGGVPFNGSPRSVPTNGTFNSGIGAPPVGGQPVGGQPVAMGSIMTQPRTAQPTAVVNGGCTSCSGGPAFGQVNSAPLINSGYVDSGNGIGNAYNPVIDNGIGYGGPTSPDPGYHPPLYGSPFTVDSSVGQVFSSGGNRRASKANWTAGLYALSFSRDYEDDRLLSRNANGNILSSTDADEGDFGGYGVRLARRSHTGRGIEFRYWAFNPDDTAQIDGPAVVTQLPTSLEQLQHVPTGQNLKDIYDSATNHVLVRNTDINNFEVNILSNGGSYHTRRGRDASFELVGGFRWFQFDETLSYISNNSAAPTQTFYQSSVENDLLGFQLGARNEIALGRRWRAFASVTSGVFNNRINTRQRFFDENGTAAVLSSGPSTGSDYDFFDEKDDVAILGELDLGLTFLVSHRLRARFGYRTFGVAGVALAGDQIPQDFTRTDRVQDANSNGSLLLHGGYVGLEACF